LPNLGIDLDNTIIDYSISIMNLAKIEYGINLKPNTNLKKDLKRLIISKFNENEWTRAQGLLYSKYVASANLYDGFLPNLEKLKSTFDNIYIVSHKTKFPYIGSEIDIREKAMNWIMEKIVSDAGMPLFRENHVYFESTINEKIQRISERECKIFIDDLPDILVKLPINLEGILFGTRTTEMGHMSFDNWHDLVGYLLEKYR
jgi:hypothetical protein